MSINAFPGHAFSGHARRRTVTTIAFAMVLAALAAPVIADGETNTGYFGRVAIKGYDPVSYFTESRAVPGSEQHEYEWLGAVWHFSSAGNRALFVADPLRYAPQYGGYCAVGMAEGTLTRDIDPEAWAIIDGKLYFNYSAPAREYLNATTILASDAHWQRIRGQSVR